MVRIRTSSVCLGVAAIAALVVNIGYIEPHSQVSSPRTGPDQTQPVVCSDRDFPFAAFSAPATSERADDGPGAALRRVFAETAGIPNYPREGWRRLAVTASTVEFGHGDPPVLDGYVVVRLDNGQWRWERSGSACIVRPFFTDGTAASWKLDPPADPPGAYSTSLRVLVADSQCASGRSPEERLHEPDVRVLPDAVVVTFIARRLAGPQTCPGHPPARRTVQLPERIGHRRLLDGATVPAQAPCLRIGVYDCAL